MNNCELVKIQRIREQYERKETTAFDELKALDKRVKRPAEIFAYTFGTASSLVMGTGMCLAMEVIGNSMALGIVVGLIGMGLAALTYPIYQKILQSRKNKYAKRIFALSDDLLNK